MDSTVRQGWSEDPLWKYGVRPHVRQNLYGRLAMPSPAQLMALGPGRAQAYLEERERLLALAETDPLFHGFEPPVWTLCDCLCGFPWVDDILAAEVREVLGFKKPVSTLLINGANGSAKSFYAARTSNLIVWRIGLPKDHPPKQNSVYCFHETAKRSRDDQQPMMLHYMPHPYRKMAASKKGVNMDGVAFINYTQHIGFTGEHFITPAGDTCNFTYYSSEDSGQGFKPKFIWCEELCDSDTAFSVKARVADKQGWCFFTFTPVDGYTDTVRLFHQSAKCVLTSPAFLLPADGQAPDLEAAMYVEDLVWRAKNRANAECGMRNAETKKDGVFVPDEVLSPEPRRDGFVYPNGRKFMAVPRVMKCANDKEAIVFFHGGDMPFANPRSMWETRKTVSLEKKKILLYGWAERMQTNAFGKYDEGVHMIPDAMADAMDGTDYFLMDPAPGRNFFFIWVRVARDSWCVLNEWPGNYEIPGHGHPGPWAENDPKKPDGRRGPAQKDFNWGLSRIKEEIARLERWPDWLEAMAIEDKSKRKPVKEWHDPANRRRHEDPPPMNANGRESGTERKDVLATFRTRVVERFMDSRPASAPMKINDKPVTLLSQFDDMGMYFRPTPGYSKDEGLRLVNNALDYDDALPVDFRNRPKGYVAERCVNTRYALENYTGKKADGMTDDDKSACGEPADLLRYFVLLGLKARKTDRPRVQGGGSF